MSKNIPVRCSARNFTLVELLLVLLLLFGVGSLVTMNYRSALAGARFEADFKGLKAVLASVEEALIVGFDPFISFKQDEKGIHVALEEAGGGFKKREFHYTHLKELSFQGRKPPFMLYFGSKGAIHPRGNLLVKGEAEGVIELRPRIIKITRQDIGQFPYPEWITLNGKKKNE